jgi:hypothetical protein
MQRLMVSTSSGKQPSRLGVLCTLAFFAGCGKEIGDDCILNQDCSPDGDRVCDTASTDGYCTIQGCDHDSCPEEAVCIRFFTGSFANLTCDPATEDVATDMCAFDELCALDGHCVARSSEIRYCMRACDSSSQCRDGYECRDLALMTAHGGQPVVAPGETLGDNPQGFCAEAPPTE